MNYFCDHYLIGGHTKDRCYKLHGYPPSKKDGKAMAIYGAQSANPEQQFYVPNYI